MTDHSDDRHPDVAICPGCPLCRPQPTTDVEGECPGCWVCDPGEVELENVTAQAPQRRVKG